MLNKIEIWMIKRDIKYILGSLQVVLSGRRKKSKIYLKNIKNKYKGKRCFIIGNGPSLTPEDLDKLKDEITFASNRIYTIFDKTDWRPTYYTIVDESVASGHGVIEGINSINCEMKFVRQQGYENYKHIQEPLCYVHCKHSRKYLKRPQFASDVTKGMYTIGTVTYAMLELAVHMGFKEIYLIGLDHKYSATRMKDGTVVQNVGLKDYFGNDNNTGTIGSTWEMDVAYEYAEKYSRENNIRIYNATRGGYLEAFERINLDKLF